MLDLMTGLLTIDIVWKLNGPAMLSAESEGVKYAVDAVGGGSSASVADM